MAYLPSFNNQVISRAAGSNTLPGGSLMDTLTSQALDSGAGGGPFDNPLFAILMPHTYERMQMAQDRKVMAQQRQIALERAQREDEMVRRYAEKLRAVGKSDEADAILADHSLLGTIFSQHGEDARQMAGFKHSDKADAAKVAADKAAADLAYNRSDAKVNADFRGAYGKNLMDTEKLIQAPGAGSAGSKPLEVLATQQMAGEPLTQSEAVQYNAGAWQGPKGQQDALDQIEKNRQSATTANLTEDYKNWKAAVANGYAGDFVTYQREVLKKGAPLVNMAGENAYDVTRSQGFAKKMDEIETDASAARQGNETMNSMEAAMKDPNFYSGSSSGAVQAYKKLAVALGGDPNQVSSMETFNAQAKDLALKAMGGKLGAGFSDADRNFVTDQVPGISNTPAGNKALIGVMRKINNRKIEIANMADKYEQDHSRLDSGFYKDLDAWVAAHPLFSANDAPQGAAPPASGPIGVGDTVNHGDYTIKRIK